ncbi:MAG: hypothetical protein Q9178_007976 [Gyalolechia marmorata]
MGDSYASGVGAGSQPADDTNRCFRFPDAYPAVIQNGDAALDPKPGKWNNVACSGNTFDQILDREFLDEPQDDGKSCVRPKWGNAPESITLTMGRNDDCDQVIDDEHKELKKPEFAEKAKVIQKALDNGRGTDVGSKFAVFVSGFKDAAIADDQNVHYVDIDASYEGRTQLLRPRRARSRRPRNLVFQLVYQGRPKIANLFQNSAFFKGAQEGGDSGVRTDADYINSLHDVGDGDPEALSLLSDTVRIFHPSTKVHQGIRDVFKKAIVDAGLPGSGSNNNGDKASPTIDVHPEEHQCHGVSGDVWVDHSDKAVESIKEFCAQTKSPVDYSPSTEDKMRLHLNNDTSKTIADPRDCVGVFHKQLIDGCDSEPTDDPDNYKFGGTYYARNGWRFEFDALATQVNTMDCDVSYRVVLNKFELRGKDLPDSKLGKGGEGLQDKVKGCGAITKWHFEWTPDDWVYEWYASGQLPIGTKACAGRALVSAGGSGNGGCSD